MNVQDYFALPENRDAYDKWLKDPTTTHAVDMTRQSLTPMGKPNDMCAERYAAVMDGRFEALRLITSLDKAADLIERMTTKVPAPDFGARDLLKTNFGYTDEEITQARALYTDPMED